MAWDFESARALARKRERETDRQREGGREGERERERSREREGGREREGETFDVLLDEGAEEGDRARGRVRLRNLHTPNVEGCAPLDYSKVDRLRPQHGKLGLSKHAEFPREPTTQNSRAQEPIGRPPEFGDF